MQQFTRISHNIDIMGGKPCIKGTRITVGAILTLIGEGATTSKLIDAYPHLTEEDVSEAVRYAAWAVGVKEDFILQA